MLTRLTLLVFSLLLLINPQLCLGQSVRLVTSQWPPYVDNNNPEKGLGVELVSIALNRKGYQTNTYIDSWQRALEGVQIGVFDATCAIWKTPEREKDLLFSQPYLTNKISFIKKKETELNYRKLSDLQGFVIGIVRDYAYNDEFTQAKDLIKIPENHIIQNLLKLSEGNIDITLGDEQAINYTLHQYSVGNPAALEFVTPPLAIKGLYLAVSKSNKNAKKIIEDFNQAINEMKQDGSYDQVISKYASDLLVEKVSYQNNNQR